MIEAAKLTKEEFDNLKPISNNVIIECVIPKEEIRPSGLIIPKDVDFFIANGIEGANSVDTSAHLDRYGVVAKVPDKIYCETEKDSLWKVPWETELELQVGDMVWFDYYRGKECQFIQVEEKTYRIVNYRFLIVAKRKLYDVTLTTYPPQNKEVYINIPLNGYCLFEQVFETPNSQLIFNKQQNKKQGIVKYTGSRNKKYYRASKKRPEKFDDIEIKVGDRVVFRNETECLLENENHYKFDNIPLRYNQRADVLGIIN